MTPKRLFFGLATAALTAGILAAPRPASACDECGHSHRKHHYSRYEDDYCDRPRYRSRADRGYYYESRRVVRRYSCGECARDFGSRERLAYHYRHSSCD